MFCLCGNCRWLRARGFTVAAVVLISIIASACARPVPAPTPDIVVLRWMQAFAAQDGNTVAQLTCKADQADIQNNRLLAMALGTPPPTFGGAGGGGQFFGGGGQPVYDITNLRYTTRFADEQSASVQVKGFLRLTSGMTSQTQPVDSIVPLIREQEQWRVCDKVG
jgi:hypothetical protein